MGGGGGEGCNAKQYGVKGEGDSQEEKYGVYSGGRVSEKNNFSG